nr:hypothetical protein OG461_04730 [Streptomyces sp. NBC_00995]
MRTKVTGPSFTTGGAGWTAPEAAFQFQVFKEGTWGSEMEGDVNRDGDYNDTFGVLYRKSDHTVRVDTDADHSFETDEIVRPYAEGGDVGRRRWPPARPARRCRHAAGRCGPSARPAGR